MFSSAPGHHLQQPRSGADLRKIGKLGLRNSSDIDEALFQTKWNATGKMRAGEFQHGRVGRKRHSRAIVFTRRPQTPLIEAIPVNQAKCLHLAFDIVDFQHGRLRVGLTDETTETPASFDKTPLHQFSQSLVHRHARTGILAGHFVFEWNTISRRPFA